MGRNSVCGCRNNTDGKEVLSLGSCIWFTKGEMQTALSRARRIPVWKEARDTVVIFIFLANT